MKISGVDIRPGNIIEYEGGIWRAVKIQHTQPGKGGAYMQVELKNLIDGRKNNVHFFSPAETVERVRLDTKDFQFLYHDGDMLVFMDKDTYDQVSLPGDLLGEAGEFLQDGMAVVMELYNERPISVQLPDQVETTIVEADAVVKGQTASSSCCRRCSTMAVRASWSCRTLPAERGLSSTFITASMSAGRIDRWSLTRTDHRHAARCPQGGAAPSPRLWRGRATSGQPQGPGRFCFDGRQARRADNCRGNSAMRRPRLGHVA